jgi:hypothetical protein
MIGMKYNGAGFGIKEINAEQKLGLSLLGHFGISPTEPILLSRSSIQEG